MTVAAKRPGLRLTAPDSRADIDVEPLQGLWTEAQYLRLTDLLLVRDGFTVGVAGVFDAR